MCWTIVSLLFLITLGFLSRAEDKIKAPVSCPGHQTAFGGSCYEFVNLQQTFFSAQAWCEQGGGHLAFIQDEETQYFLERLLDPNKDVWFGVAPFASPNLQYSPTAKGALFWLNGSYITYSNWVSSPQPGEGYGHILRDSGFQWKATKDCNKKLQFICQFDSGRSIVCAGHDTTLQCGPGHVLMIDGGFYGRKNIHYCRSVLSPPTTTTERQCGWVDVVESITAHCHGQQVCQIAQVVDSFGEPCPHLGSYLSVDYHCKDGLSLTVVTVAAVFDDVTISVKWLLHLLLDGLSCKLSTGDGHVTHLQNPEGLESSVVHKYTHPNTFVVAVECTNREMHITAQKIITIQEPITEFGVIRCYAGNLSFHATDCKALYGEQFQIQMEVKAGTNVAYRIQRDDMLLSGLSVLRGNAPQNITVTPQMMKQPGPGCHQLTLYASNLVTFPEVSTHLQICELEKVAGLQASVLTERDDCPDSPDITVGVSLEQGAPVLLLFSLSEDSSSYSETREMIKSKAVFHFRHPIQGSFQMKLRAWNVFSSLEVDMSVFCGKDATITLNGHNDYLFKQRNEHIRVVRSPMEAIATPSYSVPSKNVTITLSISDAAKLNDPRKKYEWACKNPCRCQGNFEGLTYHITERCQPDPFQFIKYNFNVINRADTKVEKTESICITLNPKKNLPTWLSLTCTEGCNPIQKNKDAKIKMDCKGQQCPQIVWNIEDLSDDKNWPNDIEKDCYKKANKRPLIVKKHGGTEYTVKAQILEFAKSKGLNITVVITSADVVPLYHTFIIKTSSSTEKSTSSNVKESKEDKKEKDSKEEDSKEKDSKEKDSKEKDSKEKDSKEKDSKEKDSKEKDSKEKDSKEKDSKEKDSKEKDSKEKDSKEKDSKEKDSKEKDSKEKDSKEKDSKEKDSKEKDSKEKDSKEKDSKEKDSKAKDSKEKDSKEKDSKGDDSKEKDSMEKSSKEEDSKEKDSKLKDSKEKDSTEKDSKEEDSKEKNSKEKDSKGHDSKEKESKEKDSKEEDSKEKNSKEKDSKEEDSKERDSKDEHGKEKDSKEKDSKEKSSKQKDSKEEDSKEKNSKEKGSKEEDSKEKDSKDQDSKEKDNKEDIPAVPASTSPASTDTTTTSTTANTADAFQHTTTDNFDSLRCSISPQTGTILEAFVITCNTEIPCSDCQYCFKTIDGKHLRCSNDSEVESVFLPLGNSSSNYNLIIKATAKNSSFVTSTTVTAKVLDSTSDSSSSLDGLKASVENALAQLEEQGQLSGETVGQIFSSVANKLNAQSDESKKTERQKLREKMLYTMIDIVNETPINTPDEVQVTARGLTAVVQRGTELSFSAQEEASLFFAELSSSLIHMDINKNKENMNEVHTAASTIVEGASNMLDYSSSKNISDALLLAMSNTQSALLAFKDVNERPTIIQQGHIGLFVKRVTPESLHTESINISDSSSPSFSLPKLTSDMLPKDEPVDIRMLSVDKNPFSWNERGNISGQIGALSLTTTSGSSINVENLSEDIKILLPRHVGEQVNTSVLDLGNYSTTAIDIRSADNTLVIKMVPSKDPLPIKLLLGYMDYPTETNNVAMTEMPHHGTTQEERYSWLLDPKDLKGNTGLHYLVVRPIVGPGIKSINATLSITSITAACKFWDESKLDWSKYGCRVGVNTTHLVTQCLCNHLTFFGSSFFVTPNLVDPSRTAELFGTFAENPVVVCFVGSLFVAYLLVVVWARRKDIQDIAKVKVTVLEDNDPMDEYRYLLSVSTGHRRGASTSSQVTIILLGAEGNSEPHHLTDRKKCVFERGAVDVFLITTPFSLGDLQGIRLWHNNSGSHPAWYVGNVMVQDLQTEQKWHFLCNSWLSVDSCDCSLDKVFPVSTEMDLMRFSNLFFMKTTKDFSDGHLWYSVISRPASSTFTCVQRVSCCFSLLLCTMLTSIMFYGIPTDPSEQTMDLGHFEFSWQQFMIGVQSSLIMFPVNILIVSIFRMTRPWEMSCCKRKTEKSNATDQTSFSQTNTANMNDNITLDTVIKDITRITSSLSKTVKSNMPCKEAEFGPGQQVDINAVLFVVEDFIKQNNKTSDTAHPNLIQPQILEGSTSMHPGSTVEGIQKKSNKTQYLYRQLCHIDKELSMLGPSGFPTPHSYSQALQQVQGMKGFLEDKLFKVSDVNPDELTQKRLSPAESTGVDTSQRKRACCHGGLPWWFIFVGWLLVITSSVIAGYFTMLYGLKFGKERSVSWLVSMIVSFFQSILIIQPLKVLCLAIFFALVIKKVDEEEFQNVEFEGNQEECKGQQVVRRDSSLYEPPPPADIEKMRRRIIMEQKAFALLKEILTYMAFMWMLLLVAYGQRDPNAFFLNQHIRSSFSRGISGSMSLGEVFTWANTSLLSNLFGVYPGFITDGNSKLVGNARLRQLRVQKNSCETAGSMLQFVPDCHAHYSWEAEDRGSYDPGWNQTVRDNISTSTSSPWMYQTQEQLRSHPVWGKMVLYRGGGFVAELGPDLQNASSTLECLFRNTWLDVYTRAIIVEFTIYNANVNLFCIVTLLLETTAVGAFQFRSELQSVRLYQSTGGLHIFVMAAEIIYLLFILYYMFLQGKLMKQQRWAYFRSKWNLLELTIILLSWSAVVVFIMRTLLGNRDVTYYQNHKDQFANFHETATADFVLQYLIAFLVLFATFKLWHLLRLNPKMNMITAALQRAWSDISGFLMIIVIMFVAYSVASNVIYGWRISSYRTFMDALLRIISLQVGIFNYDEVLDSSPVLGGLLFGSCVVFITFVVLNLLLSVILVAFNQEQIYHKPSDEEEIVDLMLKKICSLFGIRYKDTKDTLVPDVNMDSGLTLNNSKNVLNNSSIDVNISKTSGNSV